MDRWCINLLGRFELRAPNGQEVALGARKSIALLALLAAAPGQRLSRDLEPADGPRAEVVPFTGLPGVLPFYREARVTPADHAARIAIRQAAVAARMLG